MAKFFIDIGHRSSPDTGADGIIAEEAVITEVGNLVVAKLKANGHTVQTSNVVNPSSVADSLNQRVAQSNAFGPDLFVSLHANALSLIHISEPTRRHHVSRMPSSA